MAGSFGAPSRDDMSDHGSHMGAYATPPEAYPTLHNRPEQLTSAELEEIARENQRRNQEASALYHAAA